MVEIFLKMKCILLEYAKILKKVHQSESLKRMLQRVGGRFIHPKDLLSEYRANLASELIEHPQLKKAHQWLIDTKLEIIIDSRN